MIIERTRGRRLSFVCAILLCVATNVNAESDFRIDSATFGDLRARAIGPAVMSGRIADIAGSHDDPNLLYVGAASGGVWKTTTGGTTFKPVFDDYTQSIGALALDQSNPDTVWVGTGEPWTRNSVSIGTGLYKSSDAAKTWKLVGLEDSERIARILIHPQDSDTVYVAALGHLWNANEQRGVYKSSDGGKTWEKVLYVDENTGCADLAIDPQEPDILYAAMWQFRRQPDFFNSGGPGSGLYKTVDGGKNWEKLGNGLPEGDLGRISLALSPSRPSRIYAIVEAEETALYRSDDSGASWVQTDDSANIQSRPFYFGRLVADPQDHDRVYRPAFRLSWSRDGGETFADSTSRLHSDHHALWINRNNPNLMFLGTDGGLYVSYDRALTWRYLNNLPLSQFYQVGYDLERPYNVYGGLQDNGSWMGPSQAPGGVQNRHWRMIGFGDGFHVYPEPGNPEVVYWESQGGNLNRWEKSQGESQSIRPLPRQGEPDYRFNWNTPIHVSPTDPSTVYVGAQFLFRSRDRGRSWQRISDDLTTNDPQKQRQHESGGLTIDNSTAENHCTIYTISESPRDPQVIWVGTDDGNLQLSRNGGMSWENLTDRLPGLPPFTWVSQVRASNHEAGTAYVAFDGHRTGDMATYVYRSDDFGQTWQSLASDTLEGYAHVIRDDLVSPDLLFLGTEFGLFLSTDRGGNWARFSNNLPKAAVRDIAIHPREGDLILATHGRGIYIIDDLTPLRSLTAEILTADAALLDSRPSVIRLPQFSVNMSGDGNFVGDTIPSSAGITYFLRKRHIFGDLKIEVYDPQGDLLTTLPTSKRRGINRVNWAMIGKPPKVAPSPVLSGFAFGLAAVEGEYKIRLIKGKKTYEGSIRLQAPENFSHSAEDRRLRREMVTDLYGMQEDLAYSAAALTSVRDQARSRSQGLEEGDALQAEAQAFADRIDALHKTLVATRKGSITGEVQLREKALRLYAAVNGYSGRPTQSQQERARVLQAELESKMEEFEGLLGEELSSLNQRLGEKEQEAIQPLSREDFDKQESGSRGAGLPRSWVPRVLSAASLF